MINFVLFHPVSKGRFRQVQFLSDLADAALALPEQPDRFLLELPRELPASSFSHGRLQAHCRASVDVHKTRAGSIDTLDSVGIATVIASGNDGYSSATGFPGCISTAITVGATRDNDQVVSFSNSATWVDLLAPGVSVQSSVTGGGFGTKSGTSMATPHVMGAWGLLKSTDPTAGVDTLLSALQATGEPITDSKSGITTKRIQLDESIGQLVGSSELFQWTANGAPVSECSLTAGSSPGGSDYYDSGSLGTGTSVTATGLPTDGSTVHVRLWYKIGESWLFRDYQYTAVGPQVSLDPITSPIVVGGSISLTGSGFTAGSVVQLFVASATGPQTFGPFTPDSWAPSLLVWQVDPAIPLGAGFGTIQIVNTDQASSNRTFRVSSSTARLLSTFRRF